MSDNIIEMLTSQLSEILKVKFLSPLEFGNFKHYPEKFLATDKSLTEIIRTLFF
jgi:hypothetical protein